MLTLSTKFLRGNMIRKINSSDKETYIELVEEFYNSEAVMHPIARQNIVNCFDEMIRSDTYAEGFIIELDKIAGYAIVSQTYSQEAGGFVLWLEEIYIKKEYRGKGLGKEFFTYIDNNKAPNIARIRLEVEADNLLAIKLYQSFGYVCMPYMPMYKETK